MKDRRRQDRSYIRDLSKLVAAWDPIGLIGSGSPDDEYDCLLAPIVGGLREGLSPNDLAAVLRDRMMDHFEAEPSHPEEFAADVIAWHRTRRPN